MKLIDIFLFHSQNIRIMYHEYAYFLTDYSFSPNKPVLCIAAVRFERIPAREGL